MLLANNNIIDVAVHIAANINHKDYGINDDDDKSYKAERHGLLSGGKLPRPIVSVHRRAVDGGLFFPAARLLDHRVSWLLFGGGIIVALFHIKINTVSQTIIYNACSFASTISYGGIVLCDLRFSQCTKCKMNASDAEVEKV